MRMRDIMTLVERLSVPKIKLVETDPRKQDRARRMMENPAFREWFGSSRIVDQNGLPFMCYHGTTSDFASFGPGTGQNGSQLGTGLYVATDAPHANRFADLASDGRIMPLYVRATKLVSKKDMVAALFGQGGPDLFAKELKITMGEDFDPEYPLFDSDDERSVVAKDRAIEAFRRQSGFDAIWDNWQIRLFDPSQVKAAYGNSGSFGAGGSVTEMRSENS